MTTQLRPLTLVSVSLPVDLLSASVVKVVFLFLFPTYIEFGGEVVVIVLVFGGCEATILMLWAVQFPIARAICCFIICYHLSVSELIE